MEQYNVTGLVDEPEAGAEAGLGAVEQAAPLPDDAFSKYFVTYDDLDLAEPPPNQLVQGLLVQGQTSLVAAQPNTGKSAIAVDIAAHVGSGTTWAGRKVERAPVVYVAAESPATIKARLLAMKYLRNLPPFEVMVLNAHVDLSTPEGRRQFRQLLDLAERHAGQPPGLVIVDTYRNATPGGDENDAGEVKQVIPWLHQYAEATGAHVMVIHHTTKAGTSYSGSGVFGAITDTEIILEEGEKEHEGLVRLFIKQQRGLNTKYEETWYRLTSVETGRRDNFDAETVPMVDYVDDLELAEVEQKQRDQAGLVAELQAEADARQVISAMQEGYSTLADLMKHTGVAKTRVQQARNWAVEQGLMGRLGEGKGARYALNEEAINDQNWG